QAQGVWEEAPLGADEVGVGFCVPVSLVLPAQPPPPVSPAQVAIVTGHAYLGEALGLFLARLGFSVARFLHAETLRAAVHSDGVAPRTVCLDEDFAHDAELVTFLRGRGVQVIALVSRGGSAPEFAARKAGVTAVVGKPVLFGELSAALIESTAPAPPSIVAATPDRKRILVAEDHALNREIVLAMLARLGRVGVAASDGHDAVDQCAREVFDLVLMDIQMPGLDGLEATRSIRRAEQATGRAPVPIVALTANVLEDDRPAAMASGMNDYLAKPITVLRLHEVLERWCSPRTPGRPVSPEDLDLAALKALPGVRGDLASPQAGRYVALFVGESRGQSERLLQAASQGDLQGVAAGCHRLKSAAAGVGAVEVARLARALEASIKSAASQADVIVALDAICVALQRYRDAAVAAGVKWPDADCYAQDPP
ncbi:MAG: response regulator, partial [Zoogloeaceae bacterium]|nr:response regulator [Zoogloeaceae bacterium]